MIGVTSQGGFKTGLTAAYPLKMNQMLAHLVFDHWISRTPTPLEGMFHLTQGPKLLKDLNFSLQGPTLFHDPKWFHRP